MAIFSLSELLGNVDSSTMILGALFIIFFAFLHFTLSRFFRDRVTREPNKPVSGIIAFAVSALIVYGLSKYDFGIEDFLFDIGIGSEILEWAVPIILLLGAIFMIWKIGIPGFLTIFGAFFILAGFMGWVYETDMLMAIGAGMFLVGVIWWYIRRRARSRTLSMEGLGEGGGIGGRQPGMLRRGFRNIRDSRRATRDAQRIRLARQQQIRVGMRDLHREIKRTRDARRRLIQDVQRNPQDPRASSYQHEILRMDQVIRDLHSRSRHLTREFRNVP